VRRKQQTAALPSALQLGKFLPQYFQVMFVKRLRSSSARSSFAPCGEHRTHSGSLFFDAFGSPQPLVVLHVESRNAVVE
jgi:hypothetical protein